MKQGAYWTDPANQVVWGWVERYHVGIGCWGENMRVRVGDRKEAWELVPERTCKNIHAQKVTLDCFRCSECGAATGWTRIDIDNVLFPFRYCPNCGAKIEKESWWSI